MGYILIKKSFSSTRTTEEALSNSGIEYTTLIYQKDISLSTLQKHDLLNLPVVVDQEYNVVDVLKLVGDKNAKAKATAKATTVKKKATKRSAAKKTAKKATS